MSTLDGATPAFKSSPDSYTSRELNLDFGVLCNDSFFRAIGVALRYQSPLGDMAIQIVHTDYSRSYFSVPPANLLTAAWSPKTSHGQNIDDKPSIHIIEDADARLSDVACRLGLPISMCIQTESNRSSLQLCMSASNIEDDRAAWSLIYVARALRYIHVHGSPPIPDNLTICPLDSFLSHIRSLRAPPPGMTLHVHFAEMVQSDPLATAVIYYDIKDGLANAQGKFTYGGLFSCALSLAHKLLGLSHASDASIAIISGDIATSIVVSLAAVLCGRAFTFVASDHREPSVLDTRTGRVLQESAVQLLADPECLLHNGDLWEALDAVIPVSADPAAPACLLSFVADDVASARFYVSHAKLVEVIKRRRMKFECTSSVKALFHQCAFDDWTAVFVWETFFHHGIIQVIKTSKQCPDIHAASLVQQLGSSHLATDSEDVILSLCETFGVVRQEQALKAILVKTKGFVEPLARFAGLKMIAYDEDWDEAARVELPPTPPEKPDILYQDPECSVDPTSILERVSKGKALDNMGANVTNIGDGLLVKYGIGVRMTEVHNALYARKNTTIPIPNVHLVFKFGSVVYMVTDYIHGANLLRRWTTLTEQERCFMLSQLKDYLAQLRDLRGSTPGPVDGSRFEGPWFTFYGKDPFPTYEDMVAWLNRMLKYAHAEHLVEAFSTAHPLVFTHQDISPRNLILDEEGRLWVIDWDRAGWYPIYFEYACIQVDIGVPEAPTPEDWRDAVCSVMPDYSNEYRSLRAIARALDTMPLAF